MRKAIALLAISLSLSGCAALGVGHTPVMSQNGSIEHLLRANYGGINGPREMAINSLKGYADGLCKSGYTITNEYDSPVMTRNGTPEITGMMDLAWQIKCNAQQPKS